MQHSLQGARITRALAIVVAVSATLAPAHTHAQVIASLAPASCSARNLPATSHVDTALITGAVVRFGIGASNNAVDLYLAHAIGSAVSAHLQRALEMPVRARSDGQRTGRNDELDAAAAIAEGRVLGVQWVISGTVERRDNIATITWRVHDARTGRESARGSASAPVAAYDSLAFELAERLSTRLSASPLRIGRPVAAAGLRNTSAIELLLEGLFHSRSFDPASWARAESALRNAVSLDSTMLTAWQALAEVRIMLAEWGGPDGTPSHEQRSGAAIITAHRALALSPENTRSLALVARAHLVAGEAVPARQAIDGLRRISSGDEALQALDVELASITGDRQTLDRLHGASDFRVMRDVDALYERAEWHRRSRRLTDACRTLNRVLLLDPQWAPAAAMRSVVRAQLGDRRGAWIDAEVTSRLGRPTWGTAAAAFADVAASDSVRARDRLRQLKVRYNASSDTFGTLLNAAALLAIEDAARARQLVQNVPCGSPQRRLLATDPLLTALSISPNCR